MLSRPFMFGNGAASRSRHPEQIDQGSQTRSRDRIVQDVYDAEEGIPLEEFAPHRNARYANLDWMNYTATGQQPGLPTISEVDDTVSIANSNLSQTSYPKDVNGGGCWYGRSSDNRIKTEKADSDVVDRSLTHQSYGSSSLGDNSTIDQIVQAYDVDADREDQDYKSILGGSDDGHRYNSNARNRSAHHIQNQSILSSHKNARQPPITSPPYVPFHRPRKVQPSISDGLEPSSSYGDTRNLLNISNRSRHELSSTLTKPFPVVWTNPFQRPTRASAFTTELMSDQVERLKVSAPKKLKETAQDTIGLPLERQISNALRHHSDFSSLTEKSSDPGNAGMTDADSENLYGPSTYRLVDNNKFRLGRATYNGFYNDSVLPDPGQNPGVFPPVKVKIDRSGKSKQNEAQSLRGVGTLNEQDITDYVSLNGQSEGQDWETVEDAAAESVTVGKEARYPYRFLGRHAARAESSPASFSEDDEACQGNNNRSPYASTDHILQHPAVPGYAHQYHQRTIKNSSERVMVPSYKPSSLTRGFQANSSRANIHQPEYSQPKTDSQSPNKSKHNSPDSFEYVVSEARRLAELAESRTVGSSVADVSTISRHSASPELEGVQPQSTATQDKRANHHTRSVPISAKREQPGSVYQKIRMKLRTGPTKRASGFNAAQSDNSSRMFSHEVNPYDITAESPRLHIEVDDQYEINYNKRARARLDQARANQTYDHAAVPEEWRAIYTPSQLDRINQAAPAQNTQPNSRSHNASGTCCLECMTPHLTRRDVPANHTEERKQQISLCVLWVSCISVFLLPWFGWGGLERVPELLTDGVVIGLVDRHKKIARTLTIVVGIFIAIAVIVAIVIVVTGKH